jgi:hypothetical protein
MTIEHIVQQIDDRLRAAADEITALQAARSALEVNGAAPSQRPRTAPQASEDVPKVRPRPTPRKRRAKARRATDVVPAGKLEQLLGASGGLTTAALAKEANADPGQMLPLLRELEAAGKIRRTGARRGLRWHAITDEDRIAERAAELASRSRRSQAAG